MIRKKRILMVTEASFLSTGYSVYSFEILKRLHATNKYEIAELGCFATAEDPKQRHLPWKFYGNLPNGKNQEEMDLYRKNPINSFGAWRFEEACLDFRPDIVFTITDWWMHSYMETSPFRPFYYLAIMPTVDSEPLNPQWVSTYTNADAILAYSDYGVEELKKRGVTTLGTASPGTDFSIYKPVNDKAGHKIAFLPPRAYAGGSLIVGTVMRNQKRKLFPDLIQAFRQFLNEAPPDIARRSLLYLHTSYPDWFEIPALLLEHEISHRTLFTYACRSCKSYFPSLFQDARGFCRKCGKFSAFLPNTHLGITREELANIYNLFDVYVQYATNEGFGIPLVEAGACGVPLFAIDYSAMSSIVKKVGGVPLKYLKLARDAETNCYRAVPDNSDLCHRLIEFFELPDGIQKKIGFDIAQNTRKYFNWESAAGAWEKCFDSAPMKLDLESWNSPMRELPANARSARDYQNMNDEDFVLWAISEVAGRPDLLNHYMRYRLLRDIQWGSTTDNLGDLMTAELSATGVKPKRRDFTREDAIEEMKKLAENMKFWERLRHEINKQNKKTERHFK
jgi:glycosyltransferase involved in cell wall biosynthesis